jgi:hypothetical protein
MRILSTRSLELKAVLLSHDGGQSWTVGRQYYLSDLDTSLFLDESMQGIYLTQNQENTNESARQSPNNPVY